VRVESLIAMSTPIVLSFLDLASLVSGSVGALLLALAIGNPAGEQTGYGQMFTDERGRKQVYNFALMLSFRAWRWGVGLVALAFFLQLPRTIIAIIRTLGL
jgi:hypothetical protein